MKDDKVIDLEAYNGVLTHTDLHFFFNNLKILEFYLF